jgi:hypothetical protein
MLKAIFAVGLLAVSVPALAQSDHYVQGYERSNGTYVAPHYQTNPNETRNDNYSTRGNVNPYTGQEGTRPRDGETSSSSFRSGFTSPKVGSPW